MTPTHEAAMRQALEALENIETYGQPDKLMPPAIEALRSALAQQGEQQPVAWMDGSGWCTQSAGLAVLHEKHCGKLTPLYTAALAAQPDQRFTDLLCRIHRDGGHYIAEHGFDKAVLDADTKVAQLNAMSDAPAAQAAIQERKPLTDEQIKAGRTEGYCVMDAPDAWDFELGVRFAERHHGIGEKQ